MIRVASRFRIALLGFVAGSLVSLAAGDIVHTVYFKLKHAPGSDAEQRFIEQARTLASIPSVQQFEVVRETSPKNPFTWGLRMRFADQTAYDAYDKHPDHVRFVQEVWLKEVAEFQEIDYVAVPGEIKLIDPELSHWEIWMGVPHTSVQGLPAGIPQDDDMRKGQPVGLGKNLKNVFTVMEQDGESVLKISGEIWGGLTTRQSFENYHLTCQVRWGEKKWAPRLEQKRNNGLLYHCTGRHGVVANSWKQSLEYQVQEGDLGDLWLLGKLGCDVRATPREQDRPIWSPTSETIVKDRPVQRIKNYESPRHEWTRVDLYVLGSTAVHCVNGKVVLALENARDANGMPLNRGQIQIQSESAVVYYKDMWLRPIDKLPADVAKAAGLAPAN